jgi:hypothetical protein
MESQKVKNGDLTEKQKLHYQEWKEYMDASSIAANNSNNRLDVMIVSLSGAGIYVVLEMLKYLRELQEIIGYQWLLSLSGVILLISIILNFISLYTATVANGNAAEAASFKLGELRGNNNYKDDIKKWFNRSDKYDRFTTIFNKLSIILSTLGISLLLTFYLITF